MLHKFKIAGYSTFEYYALMPYERDVLISLLIEEKESKDSATKRLTADDL